MNIPPPHTPITSFQQDSEDLDIFDRVMSILRQSYSPRILDIIESIPMNLKKDVVQAGRYTLEEYQNSDPTSTLVDEVSQMIKREIDAGQTLSHILQQRTDNMFVFHKKMLTDPSHYQQLTERIQKLEDMVKRYRKSWAVGKGDIRKSYPLPFIGWHTRQNYATLAHGDIPKLKNIEGIEEYEARLIS
jgi:hypothetical protein